MCACAFCYYSNSNSFVVRVSLSSILPSYVVSCNELNRINQPATKKMDLQPGAVKANKPTSIQTDGITERVKAVAVLLVVGCAVYHVTLSNSPGE